MDAPNVELINDYLEKFQWMDFELCKMNGGTIELSGYLDEAEEEKIRIIFNSPYMVISPLFFTYEGNKKFISIVSGKQAYEINKKYRVIKDNKIFKLSGIDIEEAIYIIAKNIEVHIKDI